MVLLEAHWHGFGILKGLYSVLSIQFSICPPADKGYCRVISKIFPCAAAEFINI